LCGGGKECADDDVGEVGSGGDGVEPCHLQVQISAAISTPNENIFPNIPHSFSTDFILFSSYMRCVSEHMKELKPFGDVPDKLSVQIKRSFVATRTYGQALTTASEVAKKVLNVS